LFSTIAVLKLPTSILVLIPDEEGPGALASSLSKEKRTFFLRSLWSQKSRWHLQTKSGKLFWVVHQPVDQHALGGVPQNHRPDH